MCYLKKDNQTLLLHRTKKKNDVNQGKWIGVGGKFENGETPEECIKREVFEETGYVVNQLKLHGVVMFPELMHGEDEMMYVFTSSSFSGEMHECEEGNLCWIDNDKISTLPMWEGDYHLYEWIKDDSFHSAKIVYKNDRLIEYQETVY